MGATKKPDNFVGDGVAGGFVEIGAEIAVTAGVVADRFDGSVVEDGIDGDVGPVFALRLAIPAISITPKIGGINMSPTRVRPPRCGRVNHFEFVIARLCFAFTI